MGTPEEMKTQNMKNEVLEITLADAQSWQEKLNQVAGVKETALFGSNIHAVVYDSVKAIPAIKEFLNNQNILNFGVKKITPSLEDVFVSAIEEYDQSESKKN